ncbi:hypothetical protein MBLNU459_g3276t2 [Dothideomycetes sp. NU459]
MNQAMAREGQETATGANSGPTVAELKRTMLVHPWLRRSPLNPLGASQEVDLGDTDFSNNALWAGFEGPTRENHGFFSDDASADYSPMGTVSDYQQSEQPDYTQSERLSLRKFYRKRTLQHSIGSDYKDLIQQSLLQRQPEALMAAMIVAGDDVDFVKSIPDNTFAEIIDLVQPKRFLDRIAAVHADISAGLASKMDIVPVNTLINDYLHAMTALLSKRSAAGKRLNVTDYELLLSIAAWSGSEIIATDLWTLMTRTDQITPSVRCYNYVMEAAVNNECHNAVTRQRMRVTPFNTAARSLRTLGPPFVAYRYGEGGIREFVLDKYSEMVERQMSLDEQTYCAVITGVAREGDVDKVKEILKRVWAIDVDDLMSGTAEATPPPSPTMRCDSILYPTGRLLHAVAHAFGINNDIAAALRIVDCISRSYGIRIPVYAWKELFLRAFVLSKPRVGGDCTVGQLPKQGVLRVWETMINEPYNVEPTLGMYDMLIKGLCNMQRIPDMWRYIQEAQGKAANAIRSAEKAHERLERSTRERDNELVQSRRTEKIERDVEYYDLLHDRICYWKQRWLRLLLYSMRLWSKTDRDQRWSVAVVPDIIKEWQQFHEGQEIYYDVPGGQVCLTEPGYESPNTELLVAGGAGAA